MVKSCKCHNFCFPNSGDVKWQKQYWTGNAVRRGRVALWLTHRKWESEHLDSVSISATDFKYDSRKKATTFLWLSFLIWLRAVLWCFNSLKLVKHFHIREAFLGYGGCEAPHCHLALSWVIFVCAYCASVPWSPQPLTTQALPSRPPQALFSLYRLAIGIHQPPSSSSILCGAQPHSTEHLQSSQNLYPKEIVHPSLQDSTQDHYVT